MEISNNITIFSLKITAEAVSLILLTINLHSKLEKSSFPNNNPNHKSDYAGKICTES
jgi:hypothetical protein